MKPFSKRDLAIIVDTIDLEIPSIEMDELTRQLKEGNFKPIVSEGISKMWQIMFFIFTISLIIGIFYHLIR